MRVKKIATCFLCFTLFSSNILPNDSLIKSWSIPMIWTGIGLSIGSIGVGSLWIYHRSVIELSKKKQTVEADEGQEVKKIQTLERQIDIYKKVISGVVDVASEEENWDLLREKLNESKINDHPEKLSFGLYQVSNDNRGGYGLYQECTELITHQKGWTMMEKRKRAKSKRKKKERASLVSGEEWSKLVSSQESNGDEIAI